LYFRSLNQDSVLDQLTKYLLQYRRVSIPSVGTIQLVQKPPQLNVVDKVILPPSYSAQIIAEETIPEHQLNFLSATLKEERSGVLRSLTELGERLKARMQSEGFDWKGIGLIRQSGESVFVPAIALEPVPAERVLRQNAEHSVLVGDQHMTSTQIAGWKEGTVIESKRSIFVIIGWILLLLSILFIVFILYQGKFRIISTGSKQAPTSYMHFQKYQAQDAF
jgi:hypothetical protein